MAKSFSFSTVEPWAELTPSSRGFFWGIIWSTVIISSSLEILLSVFSLFFTCSFGKIFSFLISVAKFFLITSFFIEGAFKTSFFFISMVCGFFLISAWLTRSVFYKFTKFTGFSFGEINFAYAPCVESKKSIETTNNFWICFINIGLLIIFFMLYLSLITQ